MQVNALEEVFFPKLKKNYFVLKKNDFILLVSMCREDTIPFEFDSTHKMVFVKYQPF